jgi:hypothetical protein
VVRPGNQVDLAVNVTQVPAHPAFAPVPAFGSLTGPLHPLLPFADSDFWVHGISIGVEVRF